MSNSSPCKDCQDRHTACHDQCEKYLAWKEELNARKEAERLQKSLSWTFAGRLAKRKPYNKNISPEFEKYSS